MRIDLFLKLSGLLKTRSVAGKACRGGFVMLNGRTVRSSATVAAGDTIELTKPDGSFVTVRVEAVPGTKQVSRKERGTLVSIVDSPGRHSC
jgi:ribosomal 50S subunit-recycling heat shock protein